MGDSSGEQSSPKQPQQQQRPPLPPEQSGNRTHFLNLLRSYGDFAPREGQEHRDEEYQQDVPQQLQSNEDTVRASNVAEGANIHQRSTSSLPDLFVPPSPAATSAAASAAGSLLFSNKQPGIRPRTTMSMEYSDYANNVAPSGIVPSSSIPNVASAITLVSDNTTSGRPHPPRPPPVANRDQSVFYTTIETGNAGGKSEFIKEDEDSLLDGEGIAADDDDERPDQTKTNEEKNPPQNQANDGNGGPSIMSPRTTQKVEDAFLYPSRNSPGKNVQQPQQPHLLSPSKKPENIRTRGRSVSFGRMMNTNPQQSQRQLQQQRPRHRTINSSSGEDIILNQSGSISGSDDYAISFEANMSASNYNLNVIRKRLQSDKMSSINLDDLLSSGPYEMEAETNILKALEVNNTRHQRYFSETSTILSGVPDTVAHDFSLEDEGEVTMDPQDGSQEAYSSSYHGASLTDEYEQQTPPPPPFGSAGMEEEMPLIKTKNKRSHRRTMSVEDRLAGLTIEYSNLEDSKKRSDLGNGNPEMPINIQSSGDVFRNNTAVIAHKDHLLSPVPRRKYTDISDKLPAVVEIDEETPQISVKDDRSSDDDDKPTCDNDAQTTDSRYSGKVQTKHQKMLAKATDRLKDDLEVWRTFFSPRRENVNTYIKFVFIWMGIPLIGVAFLLYYAFDNPPTYDEDESHKASVSWWLLFCARQVITLSLALFLQLIIVDFLSVGTRIMLRIVGPILTLLVVQSRGWPFVFFFWSILNFGLSWGDREFARHWLYWQDYIGLFNDRNRSGDIVNSSMYTTVLILTAVVSVVVAIKRFAVGLWLSRNTFHHYGAQLAKLMNKMVLVSQVAHLAKRLARERNHAMQNPAARESTLMVSGAMKRIYSNGDLKDEDQSASSSMESDTSRGTKTRDKLNDALNDSQRIKIFQLLDEWEEPDRHSDDSANVPISAVLRFRNALNLIHNDHAFSLAFGSTSTREACIESAQETYGRLLAATPGETNLNFETLGLLAVRDNGEIDQEKARDLVKVFRPRRDGILTMLDFVKSTDSVYKEFRLLQASIENSSQIDIAFENILNIFFYAVLVTIILSVMGFDPLSLFLSLSSVILAFAFMIGSASSKYFEGILFILVRRPYGIGDIIHISNTELETNPNGSVGWIVQKVTLFETVATWVPTLERASFNNGSLANSRVINWRKSPTAKVNIQLHFPIETKYEQIEIFKKAVEEFMKVRPREWLQLNGFRVNRILTEQSYMQVTLLIQHRDSWQNIAQILDSKSNLVTYCSEVQKKLGMQYKAPALPVDLRGVGSILHQMENTSTGSETGTNTEEDSADAEARMNYFRLIAKTRHQIRSHSSATKQ